MHVTRRRAQRAVAALLAASGAGVLGIAVGGMGPIDRDLQAAAAATRAPAQTVLVEVRTDCPADYEWQRERRY